MKIYIDFDDVICETAKYFTKIAKELFGIDIPYRQVQFFNLQKSVDLSDEQYTELMRVGMQGDIISLYHQDILAEYDEVLHRSKFKNPVSILLTKIYTNHIRKQLVYMMTAKVFENGRSHSVRLPKECRFTTDEVAVNKIGDIVLLMPKTNKWSSFMQAVDMFSDDFMEEERNSSVLKQEREEL